MSTVKQSLNLTRGLIRSYTASPIASTSRQALLHTPRRYQTPLLPRLTNQSFNRWNSSQSFSPSKGKAVEESEHDPDALRIDAPLEVGGKPQQIGQIEPRLSITFTCTANECGHRSTHEFAKRSYEKGIVLVQCPSCKSRHLIADHLGWFKESTDEGNLKTVEDLLRAKGEVVRKGKVNYDGDIEYDPTP